METKKLDKSRHYGLLFVGAETIFVQDGIKFSPKTERPIKEEVAKKEKKDEKVVKVTEKETKKGVVCKKCGKVCASKAGLSAHSRYCKK